MVRLHKYSGAGNDFVVLDGRTEDVSAFRTPERIAALCDRETGFLPGPCPSAPSCHPTPPCHPERSEGSPSFAGLTGESRRGADGLRILTADPDYDFRMEYYNSDGSGGMMCGNGGRCIVAFADALGLVPADGRVFRFVAADGVHTGEILRCAQDDRRTRDDRGQSARKTVRLRMIDVRTFHPALDGWFVDTGTRHFVRFVPDADAVDVETEGRQARWDPIFAPIGANANFVSVDPDGTLRVRTFEKGVEAETLACGTGITAAAIAAFLSGSLPRGCAQALERSEVRISGPAGPGTLAKTKSERGLWPQGVTGGGVAPFKYDIQARIDRLAVEFRPLPDGSGFTDVYLTGPAEEVGM